MPQQLLADSIAVLLDRVSLLTFVQDDPFESMLPLLNKENPTNPIQPAFASSLQEFLYLLDEILFDLMVVLVLLCYFESYLLLPIGHSLLFLLSITCTSGIIVRTELALD